MNNVFRLSILTEERVGTFNFRNMYKKFVTKLNQIILSISVWLFKISMNKVKG